jgi:AcrR family transcriptional regulator
VTKSVEVRRQEIINAAKSLFIKDGFDNTAVSDIANHINVASGLVYHYFKSKTDLLYAVIDEVVKEEAKIKEKIVAEHKGKAIECLMLLFSQKSMLSKKYGQLLNCLTNDQALKEYTEKRMVSSIEAFAVSLIERGNEDGSWDCPNAREMAAFILFGVNGIIDYPESIVSDIVSRVLGKKLSNCVQKHSSGDA